MNQWDPCAKKVSDTIVAYASHLTDTTLSFWLWLHWAQTRRRASTRSRWAAVRWDRRCVAL
jgi:hypothetical protein